MQLPASIGEHEIRLSPTSPNGRVVWNRIACRTSSTSRISPSIPQPPAQEPGEEPLADRRRPFRYDPLDCHLPEAAVAGRVHQQLPDDLDRGLHPVRRTHVHSHPRSLLFSRRPSPFGSPPWAELLFRLTCTKAAPVCHRHRRSSAPNPCAANTSMPFLKSPPACWADRSVRIDPPKRRIQWTYASSVRRLQCRGRRASTGKS